MYPISEKPSATAVCVEFFDNTSGWVLRNDCLPFEEHFDSLYRSKRVAAFAKATRVRKQRLASLLATLTAPPVRAARMERVGK